MKRIDYNLQYVTDRLEIQDLCIRYANGLSFKNWDLLESCFTDDALIDYTSIGGPCKNAKSMCVWLAENVCHLTEDQYFVLNQEVEVEGRTALGRTGVFNPKPINLNDGSKLFIEGSWYMDRFVYTPDGWKIKKRVKTFSVSNSGLATFKMYETS